MTRSIHHENARRLCAELRMFGSPTVGTHLGERQSGTIFWERDGWPFVENKIAEAFEGLEAAIKDEMSKADTTRQHQLEGGN